MAIEQKWASVAPQLFTSDGGQHGQIQIASTKGFKVKQAVVISAPTLPNITVQVKRVISPTMLLVGPLETKQGYQGLAARTDVSAYTVALGAFIFANEQDKAKLKPDDILQAIYNQEPGCSIRTEIVDTFGSSIDSITDSNGINRLAVDGQFTAKVDVQVAVDIEGVYDSVNNPDPDNIGLVAHARSIGTSKVDQTQRVTAKRGTVDTDTVSQDMSLHDQNGNSYTLLNPVPTTGGFEKFFDLISSSNWMKLANYDQILPVYSNGNTTLTMQYLEDSALLGEAVINFTSNIAWNLKLNRYIDDNDGTPLQDDDGTYLNLD